MAVLPTKRIKTSGIRQGFYFARKRFMPAQVLAALCLSVLLFSCATTRRSPYTFFTDEKDSFIPATFDWKPVADGASYFCYENKAFPLRYHCVKIDLSSEKIQISAFPASESDFKYKDGSRTRFFTGKRTGKFAGNSGADIAINASPFAGKNGKWDTIAHITRTRQLVGIHKVNGLELSPPVSLYCALLLQKSEKGFKGSIIDSQTPEALAEADFAFGGFWTILRDGEKTGTFIHNHDSRTACGLSQDGSTLYLLIVEGEAFGMSEGLSYPECAQILAAMGADDAMEFDGGGSSSLFIGGKNMLAYPSLRINANSIGFSFE